MTTEAIDGTAHELGTDIGPVTHNPASQTLFRTDDPVEVVEQAGRVADALKGVLTRQGLTQKIGGRDHVLVEGWTTLGSMLGVFAVKEWVRELPWPDPVPQALTQQHGRGLVFGYEASFQARRGDGTVIGGAEAECKRTENSWKGRDDYALKSMAQTRATSKALRVPLGFIVTLAGYEATPEAEIPHAAPVDDRPVIDDDSPVIGKEEAELLHERITIALQNKLDPAELAAMFDRAGAHPPVINAAAVRALTTKQAADLLEELDPS
jgi:hypothetical protein